MDYKEEQTQEIEVLESIYPDELEILNANYPNIQFKIDLNLELNEISPSLTKQHSLEITFTLPETYPDEPPLISIDSFEESLVDESSDEEDEDDDGIEFDDHGNKILKNNVNLPDAISFNEYIPDLETKLLNAIDEDMLLGMQMCFTVISNAKEFSETWFSERLQHLEKLHELEVERREKEEQAKFNGTKVTKESYLKWRENFRIELKLDVRDEARRLKAHNGKLTGKQMFEQGVDGTLEENDTEIIDDEADLDQITTDLKETAI
ncbi:hypothetical protein KAFR_0B05790 [Kazachstania africana CBS 2517]|uniref:RWD domain-containing protein n=1 Tax=Kazachstania africana (strain ATCC 22294 / BCRC 22015 / CBS 2517 / CECT 1963 / NBRC 1671 / NRRL Y-8276) TaxID=1071382 RepID=H2AR75_KAZAF|nr:hypothetical protein KAFR_0B05790 [Kazachstania africana CBS 2517]CCF56875.1 hypothetical protein KAFR_0B05790 [Kazachstania africana CBS 2517]